MTPLALLLATAGFLAVGATTNAHHRRLTGALPTPARRRRARGAGWFALAASLPATLAAHGPVYGPVWWIALIMTAAGIAFLALNLAPEHVATRRRRGSGDVRRR